MNPETEEVFRDKISEPRDGYFVEYTPVTSEMPFASLGLVFTSEVADLAKIQKLMDDELATWLKRFRVPLFVSSFDAKGDLIRIDPYPHLMGYLDPENRLIKRWGPFSNEELPAEQVTRAYLDNVYRDVPFRFANEVRKKVRREARFMRAAVPSIILFTVVIPVLLELISLGLEWLSRILEFGSLSKGFYEIGKAFGWIKPSQKEREKAQKKQKMEHYFYHCEKNPAAFQRLKIENFEKEEEATILREDAALRNPPQ